MALSVKYVNCLDNSEFMGEDYIFTSEVLVLDPELEIAKYKNRADLLSSKLDSM